METTSSVTRGQGGGGGSCRLATPKTPTLSHYSLQKTQTECQKLSFPIDKCTLPRYNLRAAAATSSSSSSVFPTMENTEDEAKRSDSLARSRLDALRERLDGGEWELADEETRRLIIELAGEGAMKRKYVFFSEVKFIDAEELRAIDELWTSRSNGKFGYSVQRRVWNTCRTDFTEFFKRIGWMKPLEGSGIDSPVQFTYRWFPSEFFWELKDSTPSGHLPLTNCLRGTQLLSCLLMHPAFDYVGEQQLGGVGGDDGEGKNVNPLGLKSFNPTYKF